MTEGRETTNGRLFLWLGAAAGALTALNGLYLAIRARPEALGEIDALGSALTPGDVVRVRENLSRTNSLALALALGGAAIVIGCFPMLRRR